MHVGSALRHILIMFMCLLVTEDQRTRLHRKMKILLYLYLNQRPEDQIAFKIKKPVICHFNQGPGDQIIWVVSTLRSFFITFMCLLATEDQRTRLHRKLKIWLFLFLNQGPEDQIPFKIENPNIYFILTKDQRTKSCKL